MAVKKSPRVFHFEEVSVQAIQEEGLTEIEKAVRRESRKQRANDAADEGARDLILLNKKPEPVQGPCVAEDGRRYFPILIDEAGAAEDPRVVLELITEGVCRLDGDQDIDEAEAAMQRLRVASHGGAAFDIEVGTACINAQARIDNEAAGTTFDVLRPGFEGRLDHGYDLLTLQEVADIFRVSTKTITRWAGHNSFPAAVTGLEDEPGAPRQIRFKSRAIKRYIDRVAR
jgi:Helix-turn-helix domain